MDFSVEFYEAVAGTCPVRELIVAVHGIRNKGQAIARRDIDTARERMRDWLERMTP